jgi:CHAT domain-containing protein
VDFATLPRGNTEYLVETGGTLSYASAERDLVPRDAPLGAGLLAVGAPAFDRAPTARKAQAARASLRSTCVVRPAARFAPLPESGEEVKVVRRIWPAEAGPTAVLIGAGASEASVKADAPGKRVLHLATHAFVMGSACVPANSDTLASNPLLGSGLVLAGAGRARRGRDGEDGILTAEEISALDLDGVQWAVLSACDSGLGVTRAGEGVFGLRRAFQIAGVRAVIMSLWSVDDRLARDWMESMYRARFSGGATTADAVRAADRTALAARRRAGQSTHPFYWSGFVAAGDWR